MASVAPNSVVNTRPRTLCPYGLSPLTQKMKRQKANQNPPNTWWRIALSTPRSKCGYLPRNLASWAIDQTSNRVGVKKSTLLTGSRLMVRQLRSLRKHWSARVLLDATLGRQVMMKMDSYNGHDW